MGRKDQVSAYKDLRRCRSRAVKAWSMRRRSVKRRQRFMRCALAAAAVGEVLWAAGKRGPAGGPAGWVRERWPHIAYIEERQAVEPEDARQVWEPEKAGPETRGNTQKSTVKQGLSILLEEKRISIFRIEESVERSDEESPVKTE